MSASTEKKMRQAAREAGTDKKTKAAQEAAEKARKSKRDWTIGLVVLAVVIALIIFLNTNFLYQNTKAVEINGEAYSPAQVDYYYATQYMNFVNNYGSYASLFGLDTSAGISSLGSQDCYMLEEGGTWKDYFLQEAYSAMEQYAAMCDYAEANGITLTEEEIAETDTELAELDATVSAYGFSSTDNYFKYNYGKGVTTKLVREESLRATLASKAYNAYLDSLTYTESELDEYYQSLNGDADYYDYAFCNVAAETVETIDENGETSEEVNDDTMAAAKAIAETIKADYEADTETEDYADRLDAAAAKSEKTSSHNSATEGANLNTLYADFIRSASEGDITVVENEGSGYYVVVYIGHDDNSYKTVNIRHILVKAEADAEGNYTDEAKAEAKAKAEEIYQEWQAGEATEDSFAALANLKSEDAGSNTNGGLYEDVAKNQMVEEFDAFCFADGRKAGDTGIVYGESSGYCGYHVMYYSGNGEVYSRVIAEDGLKNDAVNTWMEELTAPYETTECYWLRLTGK